MSYAGPNRRPSLKPESLLASKDVPSMTDPFTHVLVELQNEVHSSLAKHRLPSSLILSSYRLAGLETSGTEDAFATGLQPHSPANAAPESVFSTLVFVNIPRANRFFPKPLPHVKRFSRMQSLSPASPRVTPLQSPAADPLLPLSSLWKVAHAHPLIIPLAEPPEKEHEVSFTKRRGLTTWTLSRLWTARVAPTAPAQPEPSLSRTPKLPAGTILLRLSLPQQLSEKQAPLGVQLLLLQVPRQGPVKHVHANGPIQSLGSRDRRSDDLRLTLRCTVPTGSSATPVPRPHCRQLPPTSTLPLLPILLDTQQAHSLSFLSSERRRPRENVPWNSRLH